MAGRSVSWEDRNSLGVKEINARRSLNGTVSWMPSCERRVYDRIFLESCE
jgi:hypothetical protein